LSEKLIHKWKSQKDNRRWLNLLEKGLTKSNFTHGRANEVHEKVFSEMDCLQCANCCKSIPPIVSKRDSKRIASELGITVKEFSDKFLRVDSDGDTVINQSPCPFLQEDNKCSIYDVRPNACRQYPHSGDFQFFKNISHHKRNAKYCPALFEILRRLTAVK